MTDPATHADRAVETTAATPAPAMCSQKEEQRGLPISITRMVGLETAAKMLGGKERLADAMAVSVRCVNYKLNAERGISDADLTSAAQALEAQAEKVLSHAGKLRVEAGAPQ